MNILQKTIVFILCALLFFVLIDSFFIGWKPDHCTAKSDLSVKTQSKGDARNDWSMASTKDSDLLSAKDLIEDDFFLDLDNSSPIRRRQEIEDQEKRTWNKVRRPVNNTYFYYIIIALIILYQVFFTREELWEMVLVLYFLSLMFMRFLGRIFHM